MPEPARFCARCGGAVEIRNVDERPREVCSQCSKVFYRNPLPVASSIVLNDAREVLLVKRGNEPHRGMWCLPAGFAERGETIDQAALRELEEETGIEGRPLRLLAAESTPSDFYGDLLFVTFEVERTGGDERAGDDAEATAWFPIGDIPPLAFTPHESAVEACVALHREEWAIRDSFRRMQSDARSALLSDVLVTMVRDHAEEISARWLRAVLAKSSLPTYSRYSADTVRGNALEALRRFRRWLADEVPDSDVRDHFRAIGGARHRQGYALSEVLSAFSILKREIWSFARETLLPERVVDVYRLMELDHRTVVFFDRAHVHIARGYAAGDDGDQSPSS